MVTYRIVLEYNKDNIAQAGRDICKLMDNCRKCPLHEPYPCPLIHDPFATYDDKEELKKRLHMTKHNFSSGGAIKRY